jgi:hypothetical protein
VTVDSVETSKIKKNAVEIARNHALKKQLDMKWSAIQDLRRKTRAAYLLYRVRV